MKEEVSQAPRAQIPLAEMNTDFLYLAAQDARLKGKIELAVRFLQALVQKAPQAAQPRAELAELLLHLGKAKQAQMHAETLIKQGALLHQAHLLKARALAMQGKIDQAAGELESELQNKPSDLQTRVLLIQLYLQTSDFSSAIRTIQEGIRIADHPLLRSLAAQAYLRQGNIAMARRALAAQQRLSPDDPQPVLLLSDLDEKEGKLTEAEKRLRRFLSIHPDALLVGNALGRLLIRQGRIRDAVAVYEDLSQKTGGIPEVYVALGLLHYQLGAYAEAAESFRRALVQKPHDKQVRFYLAVSLEAAGKKAEAEKLYADFDPKDKDYVEAQLRLAGIELDSGRHDQAAKRLIVLLREHPDLADAYLLLSAARIQQKRYKLLLEETKPALKLKNVPTRLLFNRAIAYEELKDYEGVERSLRHILEQKPNDPEALNFLGYSYAERGIRLDEAEELIRKALKVRPNDGYYLDSLAWVYYQRGEYAKALEIQKKAVEKVSNDPVMLEHLGDILWKLHRYDEAKQAWRKALKFHHKEPAKIREKIARKP